MQSGSCLGHLNAASRVERHAATVLALALALYCSLPAFGAQADLAHGDAGLAHFLDVTNPYVSLDYAYDSNVLRFDDITPAVNGRSDQYATLALGFNSDIQASRQRFRVIGEFDSRRYNNYSNYDYQGGNFAANWHWTESDTLTGTAGYRFRRSLRDFANELSPKPRPYDLRTENQVFGSADMDLPQNWKGGVRGEFADITFSDTPSLNLQKSTVGASLAYVSSAGNELGMDLEGIHGNYVNNPDSNYDQYSIGPTLKWKFTVRTQLDAALGYTKRNYTGGARPDYGGATGHVALTIADAGRGSLTATAWRDVSNLTDEIPDYTVVDGVSLEPGWTLSNGITIRLRGSYEHRDFRDASGTTARLDDIGVVSGFLDWPIGRHIKLTGGITTERRSSTRLYQDYEYLLQQIQITGTF
jgi:hypothetical protein